MKRYPIRRLLSVAVAAVLFATADASAWSHKEHIQFTRLAAMRIVNDPAAPADLKTWLKAQTALLGSMDAEREWFLTEAVGIEPDPKKLSGLLWWVVVPDIESLAKGNTPSEPTGRHERFNHYIDLEFVNPAGPLRTYQPDLSAIPKLDAFPRDVKHESYLRAGYLPFAREHAYNKLVEAIGAGKLAPDPAKPDEQGHAVRWAGYLVHYTADNTQPHHATMDYKSAQYFKGLKNSPNVHAEMEYRMADEPSQPLPELRAEFWVAFAKELDSLKETVPTKDLFTSTLEVATASYRALPLIGEAAKAAQITDDAGKPSIDTAKFFRFAGTVEGRPMTVLQMKARQTAWAVVRIEGVLRQAWAEAR